MAPRRSVNVKYYLSRDGSTKVDAARIEVRQGGNGSQATHFYFIPAGKLCADQHEVGTPVDESAVEGQSRGTPAQKKKAGAQTLANP